MRAWDGIFDETPSDSSLALLWSKMVLDSIHTGRPFRLDHLFEDVLDQIVFLQEEGSKIWYAIEKGDIEKYVSAIRESGMYESLDKQYIDLSALSIDFLFGTSEHSTIPSGLDPNKEGDRPTIPQAPRSITNSRMKAVKP
jgi:hypothetical protein